MDARSTRRLAVCSGAVVTALGAGLLIVPMAHADGVSPVTLPSSGVVVTPSATVGALGTAVPVPSVSVSLAVPGTPASSAAPDPSVTPSTAATSAAPGPSVTPSSAATSAAPDPLASLVGTVLPTVPPTGVTTPTGIASIDTSSSGGVTVVIGQQPDGGSVATVHLGASSGVSTSDGGLLPVSVDDVATPVTSPVGAVGGVGAVTQTAAAAVHLLSLDVTPSLGTVYPVRDGYRDTVLFRLGAVTSDERVAALTGTAVLRRGGKQVARWAFSRSDQGLRWDGRTGGRIKAGTYTLTVSAKDALGAVFQDKARVAVSRKRLVAQTRSVTSTMTSGTKRMFAPARAALARGLVTVVVRTAASHVKGKQYLVFAKDGRRLAVRVRNGVHDSREITVPANFDTFAVSHTWKDGTVRLKKVRLLYTYQALK